MEQAEALSGDPDALAWIEALHAAAELVGVVLPLVDG